MRVSPALVFASLLADTFFAEIRLKIYGYLLLDPPYAFLAPVDSADNLPRDFGGGVKSHVWEDEEMTSDDGVMYDSFHTGYGDFDSEDDMRYFGDYNPYGVPMGDMCDGMFNEVYNNFDPVGFGNDMFHGLNDDDFRDYMDDDTDDDFRGMDLDGPDKSSSNSIDDENESGNDGNHGARLFGNSASLRALPKGGLEQRRKTKRHLAILRTNCQIYNETSSLLHSDLQIVINPGDPLADSPGNAVVEPTRKLWRHDPFKGLGFTNAKGQTRYKSSFLDGSVDPHVFARFEKVCYNAVFDFDFDGAAPSLHVDNSLRVRAEDEAKFVSYLTTVKSTTRWFEDPIPGRPCDNGRRETLEDVADIPISSVIVNHPSTAGIVQKFADLLSKSPLIRDLKIILDLEVRDQDPNEDTTPLDSDETDSEQDAKDDEKIYVANERATELFLESHVLDPLRKLSNVKCFSLLMDKFGPGGEIMKPQPKHLNTIRELKEVIEKNWVVKHGPR